jgi:hypothetical protein
MERDQQVRESLAKRGVDLRYGIEDAEFTEIVEEKRRLT